MKWGGAVYMKVKTHFGQAPQRGSHRVLSAWVSRTTAKWGQATVPVWRPLLSGCSPRAFKLGIYPNEAITLKNPKPRVVADALDMWLVTGNSSVRPTFTGKTFALLYQNS